MKKTLTVYGLGLLWASFSMSACTLESASIDYEGGMHCDAAKDLSYYPVQTGIAFVSPEYEKCKQAHECVIDGNIKKCAPCEALGMIGCGEERVCVDLAKANMSNCNTCLGNYMNLDQSTRELRYICETDISTDNKHCGKKENVSNDISKLIDCTKQPNSFCLDGECQACDDNLVLLDIVDGLDIVKICIDPKTDVRYCGANATNKGTPCKNDEYCDNAQCKVCRVIDGKVGLCNASNSKRICTTLNTSDSCGACGKTCEISDECWLNDDKFACYPKGDVDNCGGVGISCTAQAKNIKDARCTDHQCQYDCKPGYVDAKKDSNDERLLDGCDTSVQTAENCGGIGIVCGVAPNTIGDCFVDLVSDGAYIGCKCTIGYVDTDKDPSNGCEASCEYPRTSCINPNACDAVLGSQEACAACNDQCQVIDPGDPYIASLACFTALGTYKSHNCQASQCAERYYTENYAPGIEASKLCQTPCPANFSNCANSINECGTNLGSKNLSACKACKTGYGNCDGNWDNGCETKFISMNLTACEVCNDGYGNCDNNWINGCETKFISMNLTACGVCNDGYGNCDNNWGNGCEVNFLNNKLLACGVCKDSYGNCDNNWDNGCETDLNTVETCGSCLTKLDCPLIFACKSNICEKK